MAALLISVIIVAFALLASSVRLVQQYTRQRDIDHRRRRVLPATETPTEIPNGRQPAPDAAAIAAMAAETTVPAPTCVGAAVVFPGYRRSPEARYPSAIEECYTVAKWVADSGAEHGLDAAHLAVAGDSVGGNIAAALTLLAKQRSGPTFAAQVLFYPVTNAAFDTGSYRQFAEGYHLRRDAMIWFWDQYSTESQRTEITASPLRATTEQLTGLPPALVITAEADVLRDEGEAYGNKLRTAGVSVTARRYKGAIHDFVMVDAMADSDAAKGATAQAIQFLTNAISANQPPATPNRPTPSP